jgi:hypothetical protein
MQLYSYLTILFRRHRDALTDFMALVGIHYDFSYNKMPVVNETWRVVVGL